jgi:hypothetical protein
MKRPIRKNGADSGLSGFIAWGWAMVGAAVRAAPIGFGWFGKSLANVWTRDVRSPSEFLPTRDGFDAFDI